MNRRAGVTAVAALVLLVVVTALIAGRPSSGGRAFDPSSTSPDGARALVLLLERFGADVHTGSDLPTPMVPDADPSATVPVAVVLRDRMNDAAREELGAWVRSGGTLVVADASSPFQTRRPSGSSSGGLLDQTAPTALSRGRCDVAALAGLGTIDNPAPELLEVRSGDQSCFGDSARAFVVVRTLGAGHVVEVADANVFTNSGLGSADDAALATALMAPRAATTVTVIDGAPPGAGDETLWGLIPLGVKFAGLQLALAFVLYSLWRARRVGRPVSEDVPIEVASSEFVAAVGRLWQRSDLVDGAARRLRAELRLELRDRLGIGLDLDPAEAARIVADRTGIDVGLARAALVPGEPDPDPAALVALTGALDDLRTGALR